MNTKQRRMKFHNPGPEYRGKPFWSWNGELKKEEIIRQVHVMEKMGLGGYFMHSRSGLITEYLSDEWFELINAGADEGQKAGLEVWLYDEDRWPSGSAGGMVTVEEKYRMKSIRLMEVSAEQFEPKGSEQLLFLAKIEGHNAYAYKRVANPAELSFALETLKRNFAGLPGEWKVLAFSVVEKECTSEFNGTTYLDTMNSEATERFLELTHEKYVKQCGEKIGTSIKGIFTDEPHRGDGMGDYKKENGVVTCSMAWTEDLFEEFSKRYGYDAKEVLPELFYHPCGERFAPIKHDYFDLANNLFLERFAIPVHEWCQKHNMLLTGHALHEDFLASQAAPHGSLMRFYEHMDCPGIDILGAHNCSYWVAKQVVSVARQLDKKWCLSEMYGCSGWEFSMKGQKILGDWQALLGINLRCQHLSWYTMEGEAKRDYPGSVLHQAPYHLYYDGVESYFARFGLFMTEGAPQCDVLVMNPIESVWSQSYAGWTDWIFSRSENVDCIQATYEAMFHMLMGNHVDFDYGDEQMLGAHYHIGRDSSGLPTLYVGKMGYHVVIIGGMETIRQSTLQILKEFIEFGGKVIFTGEVPAYVDARRSIVPADVARQAICIPFESKQLVQEVRKHSLYHLDVLRPDGNVEEEVFVQGRSYAEGFGFVLLNLNAQEEKKVQVRCQADENYNIEYWDFESGKCYCADKQLKTEEGQCVITVSIPPAGTKAFVLTKEKDESLSTTPSEPRTLDSMVIQGNYEYRLKESNVCVLDKVAWRVEDGDWSEPKEVLWADRQLRAHFGLEYRSGQMLQPWYVKKYANETYGAVELQYQFEVDTLLEDDICLVGERPEQMQYFLNGVPLDCGDQNDFWIDVCFKKMHISKKLLRKGSNTITVRTTFSRLTNVEALYLIGDFGVKIGDACNCLTVLPKKIGGQNLMNYYLPFYTGEITYYVTPEMYQDVKIEEGQRICLVAQSEYASLYKIKTTMGEKILYWEPYEADITEAVVNGEIIEVTVVASRRNVFGPLHLKPAVRGSYGPHSYVSEGEEWSEGYELLPNGLQLRLFKKHL